MQTNDKSEVDQKKKRLPLVNVCVWLCSSLWALTREWTTLKYCYGVDYALALDSLKFCSVTRDCFSSVCVRDGIAESVDLVLFSCKPWSIYLLFRYADKSNNRSTEAHRSTIFTSLLFFCLCRFFWLSISLSFSFAFIFVCTQLLHNIYVHATWFLYLCLLQNIKTIYTVVCFFFFSSFIYIVQCRKKKSHNSFVLSLKRSSQTTIRSKTWLYSGLHWFHAVDLSSFS